MLYENQWRDSGILNFDIDGMRCLKQKLEVLINFEKANKSQVSW